MKAVKLFPISTKKQNSSTYTLPLNALQLTSQVYMLWKGVWGPSIQIRSPSNSGGQGPHFWLLNIPYDPVKLF